MSLDPKPDCKHCHCSRGLFYDTSPLHTHEDLMCHGCHREVAAGSQLRRCTGCYMCAYCSQECQQDAWSRGHRTTCTSWSRNRERAAELSGNPNAWADLMDWATFHHDSFMNATLHYYLNLRNPEQSFADIAADYFVVMSVWYRNDPTLPIGQKFELRGVGDYHKTEPLAITLVDRGLSEGYDSAVESGKSKYGDSYKGTGTYMLEVRFRAEDRIPHPNGMPSIPFVKHFSVDDKRAVASPSCRDSFQQLKVNTDEGKKMRFCCGPIPGRSTCCCGGWTHEEPEPSDVITHPFCESGLFHSAKPIHMHSPHCYNCSRMRRYESNNVKLLRCVGCNFATYCSKDCQKEHWRKGHRNMCSSYGIQRDHAISLSEDQKAWWHLTRWIDFHDTSLINAATALYLKKKDRVSDVTAKHILHISLQYRNDPSSPPQTQFRLVHGQLGSKDDPVGAATYAPAFEGRSPAVEMGQFEMGNVYWGTGAYILTVRYSAESTEVVWFWKHFSIDKETARATPACRNALSQLMQNINEGTKMPFCCGELEGVPTCCCGGWTHSRLPVSN